MEPRLSPSDVVFGEACSIHGNPMCCVPTIEVQRSMATKDGSDSESSHRCNFTLKQKSHDIIAKLIRGQSKESQTSVELEFIS